MIGIKDFWRFDELIKKRFGKKWFNHVDYCGLIPIRPLENYNYFCTPKNSMTFATTGGEGVHFGFITEGNSEINDGPIVMTVPMSNKNNIIVAESFEEFLSLGYHVGWFAIEQLSYDEGDTIKYYSKPDSETTDKERLFLEIIRDELKIKFEPLSKDRLVELHDKYFNQLEINELTEFNYNLLNPEQKKMVKNFFEQNENKNMR
ncbi:hypothetical protein R9C00_07075 [Flammeovirgaceae bacterium SG7u.111]|nr:hypothetical protein [Flammeovirgaceae bacterium SG7u.132]WPO37206.1 hypothetical protein R9C00_07075 [Flammeovirgaceae bacterium SG7u.111]